MTNKEWKQERPEWCKHDDCIFKRRVQDSICGGNLPEPAPHDKDVNIFRICIRFETGNIVDIQCNPTDLGYFRWIFDALDGKKTSWLSKATEE